MSHWFRHLSPAARKRNKELLEPKVAQTLKERKGRPEGELQDQVIADLQDLGYKVAHFRPARVMRGGQEVYETPIGADGKGWPDLVAVHPVTGACCVFEIKASGGTVKPEQLAWLRAWQLVLGATVSVVRPDNREELRSLL